MTCVVCLLLQVIVLEIKVKDQNEKGISIYVA